MNGDRGPVILDLSHRELLGLYIVLTAHESELDENQETILQNVSRYVYSRLSIEELEDIEQYYAAL